MRTAGRWSVPAALALVALVAFFALRSRRESPPAAAPSSREVAHAPAAAAPAQAARAPSPAAATQAPPARDAGSAGRSAGADGGGPRADNAALFGSLVKLGQGFAMAEALSKNAAHADGYL